MTAPRLVAVVLAAGAGTRMGGTAKALLGTPRTYLARIAATARQVGLAELVVVVAAPFGEQVAAEADRLGARVVWNPEPARGMASSIAVGFAALAAADATAAWLWPVDHPAVSAETLRALVAALTAARADHDVAYPHHAGRRGHPPLIARRAWPRLVGCAPTTARAALADCDAVDVAVDDPGVVRDVDVPSDMEYA